MVKHLVIYVHGKGGNANEAEHYKPFFAESDVIGFDYQAQNPWEAQKEFSFHASSHLLLICAYLIIFLRFCQ